MENVRRIVIACMDFRLNAYLNENYNDGKTLFFRNAGGHVKGLEAGLSKMLKSGNISSIVVIVHDGSEKRHVKGCAAMGAIKEDIEGRRECNREFETEVVSFFKDRKFGSISEIEEYNRKVQEEALGNLVKSLNIPQVEIEAKLVHTCDVYSDDGKQREKVMVEGEPSSERYKDGVYYIQSGNRLGDVELAQTLGIRSLTKKM
ncbi:MAG: hypothetical protein KGH61_02610 [Candidatus Micrarchaeota archaeon]|nr:hypothetical protein [Candidatus Micrarchaeota archaeon]MDE1847817.1 hypothetical protein [Candidatus Micrarchaeota archaeon]MDE1864377.1 hypothetical protein [Candidatus Micrarchaeota archaeon]